MHNRNPLRAAACKPCAIQAHISVILFSGPKFISGVKKCIGGGKEALDMEKDCSIKVVEHLTEDILW